VPLDKAVTGKVDWYEKKLCSWISLALLPFHPLSGDEAARGRAAFRLQRQDPAGWETARLNNESGLLNHFLARLLNLDPDFVVVGRFDSSP